MVNVNKATKQVTAKIVYFGPGLSGKTTSLEFIYNKTSSDSRGEMVSLETDSDRTLFFDLLPIEVGNIGGYETKFQLYTVPGQAHYESTRNVVLKGLDGIIFVADSQKATLDANKESLEKLERALEMNDKSIENIPMVMQYNKRDLDNIMSVETMEEELNPRGVPSFETVATTGRGVFKTLKSITKLTLKDVKKKFKEKVEARKQEVAAQEERVEEKEEEEALEERQASDEELLEEKEEPSSSGQAVKGEPEPVEIEADGEKDEESRESEAKVEEEIEEIDHDRISSEIINTAGGGGSRKEVNNMDTSEDEDAILEVGENDEDTLLEDSESEVKKETTDDESGELDLKDMDEDRLLETLDSDEEEDEETTVEFETLEEKEEPPDEEEMEMKRVKVKKPEDIEKTFEDLKSKSQSLLSDRKKKKEKRFKRKDIDDYLSLNHKKSLKSRGSVDLSIEDLKNISNIRVNLVLEGEDSPVDLEDVLEIDPGNMKDVKKLTLNLKLDIDSENRD